MYSRKLILRKKAAVMFSSENLVWLNNTFLNISKSIKIFLGLNTKAVTLSERRTNICIEPRETENSS